MDYTNTKKENQATETRYYHLNPQSGNTSSSLFKKQTTATIRQNCPTSEKKDTAAGCSRKNTLKKTI